MPKVIGTGSKAGVVLPEVSRGIGYGANARVVVTSYDAICSFIGSGSSREGKASDVSGTVTVFRMLSKKDGLVPSSRVYFPLGLF